MEALGVGSGVRKLTVESLAEALGTATTDERQITRAKVIGEAIRSVSLPPFYRGRSGTETVCTGKRRGYGHRGDLP